MEGAAPKGLEDLRDPEQQAILKKGEGHIPYAQVAVLVFAIFLKGGLLGAYVPFSYLWLTLKGYSPRQLGLVALVDTICSFSLPLIGGVMDKLRAHNAGFVCLLLMLTCLKLAYLPCANSFIAILALTALTAPMLRAANTVLDALALYAFAEKGTFPRIRLVGDLGLGVTALAGGILMDASGTEDIIFYVFAAMCLSLAVTWVVASPYMTCIRRDASQMTNSEFTAKLAQLASDCATLGVLRALVVVCLLGAAVGLVATYEFVLVTELGGSGALLGACKLLGTTCAVPAWWFCSPLLDAIGFRNVQLLALLGASARLAVLGLIRQPVEVVYAEVLAGVGGFALAYCSVTVFAGRVVNEGLKGTAQTVIFVVFGGLGAGAAPFLWSFGVAIHGIQWMYRANSAILGSVLVVLCAYDAVEYCILGTYTPLEEDVRKRRGVGPDAA